MIEYSPNPITLHSGIPSSFKFDCDDLSRYDCIAAAKWLVPIIGSYSMVEAVPSSSPSVRWFAHGFMGHVSSSGPVLIVDDVFTTGGTMEAQRAGRDAMGAVIFSRGECPSWIVPLLELNPCCRHL